LENIFMMKTESDVTPHLVFFVVIFA